MSTLLEQKREPRNRLIFTQLFNFQLRPPSKLMWKEMSFQQMVLDLLNMYMKIIIILMHIPHSMKTFQFRWNIGLYIKLKTIKLVEENIFS